MYQEHECVICLDSIKKDDEYQITAVLPKPLVETIDDICHQNDRNRSQIIRSAVKDWVRNNYSTEQASPHM